MRSRQEIADELILKEERVALWEQQHIDKYLTQEPKAEYRYLDEEYAL